MNNLKPQFGLLDINRLVEKLNQHQARGHPRIQLSAPKISTFAVIPAVYSTNGRKLEFRATYNLTREYDLWGIHPRDYSLGVIVAEKRTFTEAERRAREFEEGAIEEEVMMILRDDLMMKDGILVNESPLRIEIGRAGDMIMRTPIERQDYKKGWFRWKEVAETKAVPTDWFLKNHD